ncbi:unnamed protein product, partial [Laminaria digitata]
KKDALAARYPTNPLLQGRGNAGTHDLGLAIRTIRALKKHGGIAGGDDSSASPPSAPFEGGQEEPGTGVRVPRYDKSARGGRGDRVPEEQWEIVSTRPEIVLLEGWMLGFEALPDGSPLLLSPEEGRG